MYEQLHKKLLNITPFSHKIANSSLKDNDDTIINKYTPIVNKCLKESLHSSSGLNDIYNSIFECGLMHHYRVKIPHSEEHFSFIDDVFFFPFLKVSKSDCIPFDNPEAIEMIVERLTHFNKIDISNIITPKQDKHNCWFNTTFMIFFISDLGREYSKYFRYFCITGNYEHVKNKDRTLRLSLFYLNLYIDSCLNGSIYALYINSNYIINRIYNTIPYSNFIDNDSKMGYPIRYYYHLISKLGLTINSSFVPLYEINVGKYYFTSFKDIVNVIYSKTLFSKYNNCILKEENSFYEFPQKINKVPEIIILDIHKKKYPHININDKQKYIETTYATYCLDSILIHVLHTNHVCCLVTLNKQYYLYDGASFSTLIEFDWMNYLNKDININLTCNGENKNYCINLMLSNQLLVYYRVNNK